MEDVPGLVRCGLKFECVAGLGVEDGDHDQVVGLVPEQSNVDSVAPATVKLSDHARGGGAFQRKSKKESDDGDDSLRRGSSVTVGVVMAAFQLIQLDCG